MANELSTAFHTLIESIVRDTVRPIVEEIVMEIITAPADQSPKDPPQNPRPPAVMRPNPQHFQITALDRQIASDYVAGMNYKEIQRKHDISSHIVKRALDLLLSPEEHGVAKRRNKTRGAMQAKMARREADLSE